jgi:hypothetical protein
MAKGSGLCDATGSYLVTVKMLEKDTHFCLTVEPVPERDPPTASNNSHDMKECTLPGIEPRAICFELKRRRMDLTDKNGDTFPPGGNPDLLYWLESADLQDTPLDDEIVQALKDIKMLQDNQQPGMDEGSHDISLAVFKHFLERRNRMVTEHSNPLVAATASNQALYPMGSGSSAKTANM